MPNLRPVIDRDLADVLDLNQRNVELLSPMDEQRFREIEAVADHCAVIEVDGAFAGFVILVPDGTSYDAENYRWYSERYDTFTYLDRIVIGESFRRQGLGASVYDTLEGWSRERLALEVNIDPPNEPSLAFHRGRGFVEVGQRESHGHTVAMLVKELT